MLRRRFFFFCGAVCFWKQKNTATQDRRKSAAAKTVSEVSLFGCISRPPPAADDIIIQPVSETMITDV